MPSFCKKCQISLNNAESRALKLCPVCAGTKKRCARCHCFYEVAVEGDICPKCLEAKARRLAVGKPAYIPQSKNHATSCRLTELRNAYKRHGLHLIDWEAVKNGKAS